MKKKCVNKPWGSFNRFTLNEKSTVKILTIKPGKRFSLQKHKSRAEFWVFLDNPAKVTLGKKVVKAKKGTEIKIPRGSQHRIQALGKTVNVLEISLGTFKEKDIKRLADDFGRV
tara:strand:+ start:409 stop:750 length:342 start_codon:yes stop_codon:yes gene_type:complete